MLCVKALDFMCMLQRFLKEHKESYILPFFQVINPVEKLVCVYDSMHMFQHTPAESNVRYVARVSRALSKSFSCIILLTCLYIYVYTVDMYVCTCMCTGNFFTTYIKSRILRNFVLMTIYFMKRFEYQYVIKLAKISYIGVFFF